jgi:phage terminase small subunit
LFFKVLDLSLSMKKGKKEIKEEDKKLTNRQKAFCYEYIKDWNASRACIAAGYSSGSAKEIGSENLTKPNIKKFISEIQSDIAKQVGISLFSQLNELKKIAYSDISSYFQDWNELTNFDDLTQDQKAAILEINYKKDIKVRGEDTDIDTEFVKLKLHEKLKAIEIINKMLGFNQPDNIDIKSGGEIINPILGYLPKGFDE